MTEREVLRMMPRFVDEATLSAEFPFSKEGNNAGREEFWWEDRKYDFGPG